MHRVGLGLIIGAGGLLSGVAQAEPAILYVPDEDVELQPVGLGDCSGQGGQDNSALNCADVPGATGIPAHPDAPTLRGDLMMALDAYDVHITGERPPSYLAYTMLLPTGAPQPRSENFTCTLGGINCGARKRNDVLRVVDSTQNCLVSDLLLASLYAFGRASGLEGVSNPIDAMNYPPDYSMGAAFFVDACAPIINQMGFDDMGMPVELPLECTSLDHVGCMDDQQNGHADLLDVYGSRVVDLDPPVLSNLQPGDGAFVELGDDLVLDVDLSDADPVLGGRWSIYSRVFEGQFEDNLVTMCTNDVCFVNWDDALPLKPTDSDWSLTLAGLPAGVYEVTFEAADFHGNVAEPVVQVVYVGDPPPGTTGDSAEDDMGEGPFTTGTMTSGGTTAPPNPDSGPLDDSGEVGPGSVDDGPESGSVGSAGSSQDEDGLIDHGCACRSTPSSGWGWGLMVLLAGVARRRRGY